MDKQHPPTSFGVFKPVGHVLIQFANLRDVEGGADALHRIGVAVEDMTLYTPRQMLAQIEKEMEAASGLAAIGQEMNLSKAHRTAAQQGHHWLMVRVDDLEQAQSVAEAVKPWRAERAQHYGRFIIEELIQHEDDLPQVAESPDRGLNSQTPSGTEEERSVRHTSPAHEIRR
jgi:hypothetical protein